MGGSKKSTSDKIKPKLERDSLEMHDMVAVAGTDNCQREQ